jgi:ubiquinone/menaquinone biosynthesis C-methylase UbiE
MWGEEEAWRGNFRYGHDWCDQLHCRNMAEKYLHPFLPGGELDIVEIAPGAGRFTAELIRLARSMVLVDLNQACIDLCRERFRYCERIRFLVNDGMSLVPMPNQGLPDDEVRHLIKYFHWFDHHGRAVRAGAH